MNENSLIDFNNDNCYKILSPLIPVPASRSSLPRLSDIYNNPFDKVLRTITNKDDPFECNANISTNNKFQVTIENENKENIGKLISPIQTPVKSKKYKRLSTSPLYISKNSAEEVKDTSFNQLPSISEALNLSTDGTDTSLQILSDSIINNIDDDFSCAYDLPLPDSPDDNINYSSSNITNNKSLMNIPSVIIQDENKELVDSASYTTCSSLNNAFIANLSTEHIRNRLSTRSSIASKDSFNVNSFNVESLGTSDISTVLPSVSSVSSKDSESDNPLDKAFIKDSSEVKSIKPLRCLSARKSTNHVMSVASTSRPANLNNSFAGFNYNDRNFKYGKFRFSVADEDSVFLEANQLAEIFRTSATLGDLNDEDISQCSPPWEEEDVVFVDDEDEDKSNENYDKTESTQSTVNENNNIGDKDPELQIELDNKIEDERKCNNTVTKPVLQVESNNEIDDNIKCNYNVTKTKLETDKESSSTAQNDNEQEKIKVVQNNETNNDSTGVINAQDLIHNIKAMLNESSNIDDQKKLESFLNSLALNIESPAAQSSTQNIKPINKLQRSKSDSKVSVKSRVSMIKQENKLTVPKIKSQRTAPAKVDKNLKVRNEKEKVTARGPLKAFPITNMAKIERSIAPKISLLNTTPPKQQLHSLLQIKKTSTPNDPKLKPPMAQSTPEVSQKQGADINMGTPLTKRHFGFAISPLTRPQSTSDISNGILNHSLSPRNTSGSAPTLNKSGSNLSKNTSNSSIPTIKYLSRRNSVSDMTTSKSANLNRSYENNKPIRPPVQLKRSSSFQNKSAIALPLQKTSKIDNNNSMKKYGIPGALKSLKLVPKARNVAD